MAMTNPSLLMSDCPGWMLDLWGPSHGYRWLYKSSRTVPRFRLQIGLTWDHLSPPGTSVSSHRQGAWLGFWYPFWPQVLGFRAQREPLFIFWKSPFKRVLNPPLNSSTPGATKKPYQNIPYPPILERLKDSHLDTSTNVTYPLENGWLAAFLYRFGFPQKIHCVTGVALVQLVTLTCLTSSLKVWTWMVLFSQYASLPPLPREIWLTW